MAVPLAYNVRNVRVRWRTSLLAILGVALVVAVFAVLMAMSEGFATALRSTGRADNAMILQRGAPSERHSSVPLSDRQAILTDPRLARGADGRVLASWEWLMTLRLPTKADGKLTSVSLRAVTPQAFDVRSGIRIVAGRRFTPGLDEVIVGRRIMDRVRGLVPGGTLNQWRRGFTIVGVFESDGAAFESEVWGDFDRLGALFKRGAGSNTLVVRVSDPAQIPGLDHWLRSQPRMQLQALPESQYYEEQAGPVAATLRGLALFVAFVMGVGAVFGAMNTMYAIVVARTREIGTLRALGFSRRAILVSFVLESAIVALIGGVLGCLLAFTMHGYSTGTRNLQTFSEVAFAFRITPPIILFSLIFAALMGVVGGLLPSVRAARLSIAGAVREA